MVLRDPLQQVRGDNDLQGLSGGDGGKAAKGFRVAVGIGNVGLDVQNGGAVHQVGPLDPEHRALGGLADACQLHAGQGDGVGPEGGAGGKDPHPGVAPQPGRTHRGGPGLPDGPVKDPDQPDVGEILQPPQGVGIPIGGFKDNISFQLLHQAALAGNAEFFGKIAADMGDGMHGIFLRLGHKTAS